LREVLAQQSRVKFCRPPPNLNPGNCRSTSYLLTVRAVQASVMRGSVVEVLARRGRVEFLVTSEPEAREMHWVNGQAVARTYR